MNKYKLLTSEEAEQIVDEYVKTFPNLKLRINKIRELISKPFSDEESNG